MSKKLTPEYVVMRTKCDRLEKLKNLNLWGCDLEDISVIRQIPNLEVVSLSVNRIKSLREFGTLRQLKELYLRKNFISDINEIRFLEKCPNLKVLWLSENPVADTKNYRQKVIRSLPQLTKLDDNVISIDEKNKALDGDFDEENYNEKNEDVNKSSDSQDPNEENVFETKNFYNKNVSPVQASANPGNKFSNNKEVDENFVVYKKSKTTIDDTLNNDVKPNFNKPNKNNIYNQQNYDMYSNNQERSKNIREKTPVNHKYNYDNNQYEETNMIDKFENLNVGGTNNVYSKKNDLRRETRSNTDLRNSDNMYSNNEYRNENRPALRRNSSKVDDYAENLREFNNLKNRKSFENPPRNLVNNNNNRSNNVLNCVLMLLKELNDNDLEIVRDEIDQKLGNY